MVGMDPQAYVVCIGDMAKNDTSTLYDDCELVW